MLKKAKDDPCYLCETPASRWNDPAIAEDPAKATAELRGLSKHLEELVRGRTTPAELRQHLLQMCAMCQEVVMDVGVTKQEVIDRLAFRIARLSDQAACTKPS